MNYLLLKLAEEAGELAVAAIKYRLRRTQRNLARLEGEVADVLAVIMLLRESVLRTSRIGDLKDERVKRERKRMQ